MTVGVFVLAIVVAGAAVGVGFGWMVMKLCRRGDRARDCWAALLPLLYVAVQAHASACRRSKSSFPKRSI